MDDTMRKIMWGFREREPLKSVVNDMRSVTLVLFANTSPIARFDPFQNGDPVTVQACDT